MSISEAAVERFLTVNGCAKDGLVLICPQYNLKHPDHPKWNADLDFVALRFDPEPYSKKGTVILVEVSDGGGLGSVETKAKKFENEGYCELLSKRINAQTGGITDDWPLEFLGFVSTIALVEEARGKFKSPTIHFRSLEEVFAPDWWDKREKEPLIPVPTLDRT